MIRFRTLSTVLCLMIARCTSFMAGATQPEVRTLTVPDPPALVYRKALSTAVALGTTITQSHEQSGLIQGTLHHAALLTIETTPGPSGTTLTVTATILPNTVAVGSLTDADDFLKASRQREGR